MVTAKKFLQQFFLLQCSVNIRLEQIERLQSVATQTTRVMQGVITGNSNAGSRVESSVVAIQSEVDRLASDMVHMIDLRNEIAESIANVANPQERNLLELRYLCLYSWRKIAQIMLFSSQHVFRLHQRALNNFLLPAKVES